MYLDKFKEFPTKRILCLITIAGFIIVLLLEVLVFLPIEATVSTYGILDYEFAWTSRKVEAILSVWGIDDINSQVTAIYWDFLFIVGYVSLAFGLIVIALRKSEKKIQTIGIYVAITPFLTGVFDIIENVFLLVMADKPASVSNFNSFSASLSATLKFGLLFVGIIYFVVALIFLIFHRIKKKNE